MNIKINFPIVSVVSIVALGVGLTLWTMATTPPTSPSAPAREGLVLPRFSSLAAAGNVTFDKSCASCHGANGAGSDKGPPLIHDIYNPGHHNDESFFRAVSRGTRRHHWNFGDMPPQPKLSRQDVAAIVRYIRELQEANGIVWKKHTM